MKNIISNTCLGGFIYNNILKSQYGVPFIWTRIWFEDFCYLIDNLERINFNDYELINTTEKTYHLRIADKFNIWMNHYIQDDKCLTPITGIEDGKHTWADVRYCKIIDYIFEKYHKRLDRFSLKNEIVVAFQDDGFELNNVDVNRLIRICKNHNYKLILQSNQEITENYDKLYLRLFRKDRLFYLVDDEPFITEMREFIEK